MARLDSLSASFPRQDSNNHNSGESTGLIVPIAFHNRLPETSELCPLSKIRVPTPPLRFADPSPPSVWNGTFSSKLPNMLGTQTKQTSHKSDWFVCGHRFRGDRWRCGWLTSAAISSTCQVGVILAEAVAGVRVGPLRGCRGDVRVRVAPLPDGHHRDGGLQSRG